MAGAYILHYKLELMSSIFPTPERNQLLKKLSADPRYKKKHQERPRPPVTPPLSFRRVSAKGKFWGLTRTMRGYTVQQDSSIGGKATKWVIRGNAGPDDFYIAKFGNKNGRTEIFTELFNNQLGEALGFEMAHSGIARLDRDLYFVTRNFRRSERLVHGSLMVEDLFAARGQLEGIDHDYAEQAFYSVDFMEEVIKVYCGDQGSDVFDRFIEMLVYDALIGSMDRHAMNWGVLRSEFDDPCVFRLAPLFDSARALLWDCPEGKLLELDLDDQALQRYVDSATPCIGPHRTFSKGHRCNHFEFIQSLLEAYPHPTKRAYSKIPVDVYKIGRNLIKQFPFRQGFSSLRRRVILKVLAARADRLRRTFTEGGANDQLGTIADALQRPAANTSGAV
jgi:HipA-like C-terminal domain